MTHFIDLRKKVEPQVKIIYRTVTTRQPWYIEVAKIMAVITIVTTVVWGISKADTLNKNSNTSNHVKSIGIYGVVTAIDSNSLTLDDSQGSNYKKISIFSVDISNLKYIQTSTQYPLTISDIQVGDSIIAHGDLDNESITADYLISFSITAPNASTTDQDLAILPGGPITNLRALGVTATTTPDVATSTATTTVETDTSTSTATTTDTTPSTDTGTTTNDTSSSTATTTDPTPDVTPTTTPTTTPEVVPSDTTPTTTDTTTPTILDTIPTVPDPSASTTELSQ